MVAINYHQGRSATLRRWCQRRSLHDDDDVYYYMRWRLKLEGKTENMGQENAEDGIAA